MIAAIWHGAAPPAWVSTLLAAETWGCPPWEIKGQRRPTDKLVWMIRWGFFTEQRAKKQKIDLEQATKGW